MKYSKKVEFYDEKEFSIQSYIFLISAILTYNKYGSVQELRSTFGHLNPFKITQSFV